MLCSLVLLLPEFFSVKAYLLPLLGKCLAFIFSPVLKIYQAGYFGNLSLFFLIFSKVAQYPNYVVPEHTLCLMELALAIALGPCKKL